MALQVAPVFKGAFNEYDLSVIHHFKGQVQKRVNKQQFVRAIRKSYGGSPPHPVRDTIGKMMLLTDVEFDDLIGSIRID
jgi:hypothetical protein